MKVTENSGARRRRILRAVLVLGFAVATPAAISAQAGSLPPIIDRELLFGNPEISGAQISPDGRYITFLKPHKETRNIWVKGVDEPWTAARLLTNDTRRPVTAYMWSRDSKYILFAQDLLGDENYNVYAVDPAAQPAAGQEVPTARNLTPMKEIRALPYSVPRTDPDILFVGINDRDKAWHDLYRVRISTGERTLLRQNTERIAGWVFDTKGNLRLAVRTTDRGDTETLRVDEKGFTPVYTCNVFESCSPARFHADGQRVYMVTNKGNTDLTRLVLFNPITKAEEVVESDPRNRVDLGNALFSDATDELIATQYEDERTRYEFTNKQWESDYKYLQSKFPDKQVDFSSTTRDENVWMIVVGSDTEPGERHLFDRRTRSLTFQYRGFEKLPRETLAAKKPVSYKAADGMTIPAYLTLPVGVAPKNLPVVVFVHGGPWARDSWGYSPIAQFLANRGYAVLQPNFRSSTGFGKKFLNAGNNEWGQKMQSDLTDGVRYLIAEGIADPKRVGIMGASYGGYATLAGLAFTPDLYAAGVSIVGPSNLLTLLKSLPPYWEAGRIMFHERMGNPSTAAGNAQLVRQSPLNAAARIKAPLLVVQGANDPRVNKAESEQIVIALRDRGFPVEYMLAPDEGHGFVRPINNLALFTSIERFLAKHLGGRQQEFVAPPIAARLREIMVDPKSVSLAAKVDVPVAAPKPAVDLRAGSATYKAKIELAGQSIPIDLTRSTALVNGAWVVTESTTMPQGVISDEVTLEKGTLQLRKRLIKQGPAVIEVSYAGNKATGKMSMNGQDRPISAELGGALFADGAGSNDVIAALPLAAGYTTTFRNFDIMTQQVKTRQLSVIGSESVTVPAGTFDAWKVETKPASGTGEIVTLWIDKKSRVVAKSSAILPQMNGAVATAELVK